MKTDDIETDMKKLIGIL